MNSTPLSTKTVSDRLCLACGLCCNGVIFRDVKLRAGDDAARLKALGLPISSRGEGRLPQPCAALEGCRCRVYADRPQYCRQFECALFKGVLGGGVAMKQALSLIGRARRQVGEVERLLCELGETDEQTPLSARFRRVAKRLSHADLNKRIAASYGALTLAIHELNLLVSETFYPGREANETAKEDERRLPPMRRRSKLDS